MKFVIKYARERIVYVECSNFNEASEEAKIRKKEGEVIVSVRSE